MEGRSTGSQGGIDGELRGNRGEAEEGDRRGIEEGVGGEPKGNKG